MACAHGVRASHAGMVPVLLASILILRPAAEARAILSGREGSSGEALSLTEEKPAAARAGKSASRVTVAWLFGMERLWKSDWLERRAWASAERQAKARVMSGEERPRRRRESCSSRGASPSSGHGWMQAKPPSRWRRMPAREERELRRLGPAGERRWSE